MGEERSYYAAVILAGAGICGSVAVVLVSLLL